MTDPRKDGTSKEEPRILNDYEQLLEHVEELTESGEYDLQAIMPLRRSAEENWAVPENRSRLRSKSVETPSEPTPVAPPSSREFQGSSTAELLSTLGETSNAPSEFPPLSEAPSSQRSQWSATDLASLTPPGAPPITREQGVALARGCTVADLQNRSYPSTLDSGQTAEPLPGLEVDDPSTPPERSQADGPKASKSRKWLAGVGVAVLVCAWLVPLSTYQRLMGAPGQPGPRFVLSSEPKSEVYRGDTRLGETPLVLEAENVGDGLVLRRQGFEPYTFALDAPLEKDKVANFAVNLEKSPILLNWEGLPSPSKVVWEKKEIAAAKFLKTLPGTFHVRVVLPERPPIELTVKALDPGEPGYESEVAVGREIAKALAAQPQLAVSLTSKSAKPRSASVVVREKEDSKGVYKAATTLTSNEAKTLFLPRAGTYLVKGDAGKDYLAFSQTVKLEKAESKSLAIVFKKKPPAPVYRQPAPVSGGTSSTPYYPPAPQPYRAPPVYNAPRGGGAGRIAPPSF